MNKILIVFGTRPELIKLAPVINEYRARNQRERLYIVNTHQHKDLTRQDLDYFGIDIDHQFELTRDDDSLTLLNGLLLMAFYSLRLKLKSLGITLDAVIAQGDTCTSFASAQFAFYDRIPFIHIEAGLRTDDFAEPFPEEYFRKTISSMATVHFAPTALAEEKLLAEGITPDAIRVTGNTVIDNLRAAVNPQAFRTGTEADQILITIHRRENIRQHLGAIVERVRAYCAQHPGKSFVWIDNPGYKIAPFLGDALPNLQLIQPVAFRDMIALYGRTQLIITDSGGVQEEAGYLGIPTLLFRGKTERTESIASGIAKYAEDHDTDLDAVIALLNTNRTGMFNPLFGDGTASQKIVDFLAERGI